ncbi:COG4315 family predicted lipoprotein [Sphingobacterium faecium]
MRFNKTKMKTAMMATTLLTIFSSCSKDKVENPENNTKGMQTSQDAKFGTILTDSNGKTLYFFSNDTKGSSSCTGNCLTVWPIYYSGDISSDVKIDKSQLGEITRADGKKQSTYKGWPLYYYVGDSKSGEVQGDAVNKIWYVAKPDYLLMVANGQLKGDDTKDYLENYTEGQGNTSYLTDDQGRTLYAFKPDRFNKNNYTAADFSNDALWPIFQKEKGALPSLVSATDIAVITVFGKKQLTYKGWPLYYFGQDQQRGDNRGISYPRPGVWPIVNDKTTVAAAN